MQNINAPHPRHLALEAAFPDIASKLDNFPACNDAHWRQLKGDVETIRQKVEILDRLPTLAEIILRPPNMPQVQNFVF